MITLPLYPIRCVQDHSVTYVDRGFGLNSCPRQSNFRALQAGRNPSKAVVEFVDQSVCVPRSYSPTELCRRLTCSPRKAQAAMLEPNLADMVTLSRTPLPHWERLGILHAFRPFMGSGYSFISVSALFLHHQVGGSWMATSITVTFTTSFPSSSVPKHLKTRNSYQTYSSSGTSRVPFT